MAIASGTPVPPVYLMENEEGINAFAAGYSPRDAVIGVTRGCVQQLSREELQGVIAHEFSHILNGDMRLNIRLIGILNGILVIGMIGYFLLRASIYTPRRSSRDKGGGVMAILAIGAGLAIIGFVGTFFGNLIKAAVSRQREFLADASAVQFTRHPQGIANALKRIGGMVKGASIDHPNAPEASHMFFGQAVTSGFNAMFATHPPLLKRIGRIEPDWDGTFLKPRKIREAQRATAADEEKRRLTMLGILGAGAILGSRQPAQQRRAIEQIGQPTQAHIDYAAKLLAEIPPLIRSAAQEPYGSRAVMYAMLIERDANTRRKQLAQLEQHADAGVYKATVKLLPAVARLEKKLRLPVIDLAIATLTELSPAQYDVFKKNAQFLIQADDRLELFEWVMLRVLGKHLDAHFGRVRPPRVQYYALARLGNQCEIMLSMLAYVGHRSREEAERAFNAGAQVLGLPGLRLRDIQETSLETTDQALEMLAEVVPKLKKQLITACAACVAADRRVTTNEAEVLRALADALDCPMPPLLPGQPLV